MPPTTVDHSGLSNPSYIHDDNTHDPRVFQLSKQETPKREEGLNVSQDDVVVEDCALPCLKLRFLNKFRSPKWFLVFISVAATIQGLCINGLVNVVITSIERRFGLQSTQSGMIASSYDIGSLLAMIPVSFFGGRLGASKPRWISVGLMLMGLGSFVWSLPHFATPQYRIAGQEVGQEGDSTGLCGGEQEKECQEDSNMGGSLSNYRFVFVLGQLLHGVGAAPLITLGTTFLDESVSVKSSPLYIAVFQTWFIIGPALGYVLGGQLLSFHTDFISDTSLTSSSSLWVGAWWPGFLVTFTGAVLTSFCVLCYPSSINRKRNTCQKPREKTETNVMRSLSRDITKLLSNPVYVLISLAIAVDAIIVSGLAAFLPKYLEHQFQMSTGAAAQIVGLLVVPAGGSATILGGIFIKKFVKTKLGAIKLCLVAHTVAIPLILSFMMSCPTLSYVGLNHSPVSLSSLSSPVSLSTPASPSCSSQCGCSSTSLDPVCGADGLMYLSPCHAGCTQSPGKNNFTECSCLTESSYALRENCDNNCTYFIPFLIIMFILIFLTFWVTMPSTMATLRSVGDEERSLAIGLQNIVIRLLGSIPGPVMFGYFIDRTCLLWDIGCEGQGSCLLYDNYQFSVFMCSCVIAAKSVSLIFFFSSYLVDRKSETGEEKKTAEDNVNVSQTGTNPTRL